jgi:methyl-accepting chemotaxis protein
MNVKGKILLLYSSAFLLIMALIGILTVAFVKAKVLEGAREKLLSDLALSEAWINEKYPGDWNIQDEALFKGQRMMNGNNELIDLAIFLRETRVATNVKDARGNRASGTRASTPVSEAVLKKGKTYTGKAEVAGVWNQAAYKPIRDAEGRIVGMLYVGVPNTRYERIGDEIVGRMVLLALAGLLIVALVGYGLAASVTRPVRLIIEGLEGGSEDLQQVSANILAGSQALSAGVSRPAAGLAETSASLKAMGAITRQNAEHAQSANRLMQEEAAPNFRRVAEGMESMRNSVGAVAAAGEETAKMIKTIDGIALQTNLLALKAAVEAARAGRSPSPDSGAARYGVPSLQLSGRPHLRPGFLESSSIVFRRKRA